MTHATTRPLDPVTLDRSDCPARRTGVFVIACATVLVATVAAALQLPARSVSPAPDATAQPVDLGRWLAAATTSAAVAERCARDVTAAVDAAPELVGRALAVELGPAASGERARAGTIAFVERQLSAATSAVTSLRRIATDPGRLPDLALVAADLAARSDRAAARLCAARGQALRAADARR